MRKAHRLTLLAAVAVIGSAGAAAAQTPAVRLTLTDALARGTEASLRLAELEARHAASRAAADARRADERPQVALQAGYQRTNHIEPFGVPQPDGRIRVIFPDIPDNYRTRLDLQWPIYTAGRVEALVGTARAESDAAGRDVAAARADLRLETARAYWALVTANETVRVIEESVSRMDAHLRDVRSRLDAGLVPPNDVLTVEAQHSRQRALAIDAANTRESAALALRWLLGLDLDTPLELIEPLEGPMAAPPPADSLLAEARSGRDDRRALAIRVDAAGQRVTAARASDRPVVAVAGGFDYARPNRRILPPRAVWEESWDLSVNVSWPWLDGGRTRAAVAEATAQDEAMRRRLEEFDSLLGVEVRQRRLELDAALAMIDAATDEVRSAVEARRVVAERFAVGVATSTDVLDAQVALLQADLDRTRALANARLAQARLERTAGR